MKTFSSDFWIEQWDTLNKTRSSQSGWSNAEIWNLMAEQYGSKDEKALEVRRELVRGFVQRGILFSGAKVLDIGCGPGSHAIPFAEAGCEVVAIDISEKMIERLNNEIPEEFQKQVQTRICNWHEMDSDAEKFTKEFDLVFANMTPAIGNPSHLDKLIDCSRGWCHFAGWSGERRDSLMEDIRKELAIGHCGAFEGNGLYVFNLLASKGYHPESKFTPRGWTNNISIEMMAKQSAAILASESGEDPQSLCDSITDYLETRSDDGQIIRKSTGTSVAMQWKVA